MENVGSSLEGDLMPFSGRWPKSGMMQSGQIFELPTSERRTAESESGLLPTPATVDTGSFFNRSDSPGAALRPTLGAMAKHNLWPTPTVNMVSGGPNHNSPQVKAGNHGINLHGAILQQEQFPTPCARDYRTGVPGRIDKGHTLNLPEHIADQNQTNGQLNPTWVEWLMGYPLGWTDSKDSETALFLKSPN